jgi:hypothetical protein
MAKLGAVLFETVKLTLRQLSELSDFPEAGALRERAVRCNVEIERWGRAVPTSEERKWLINEVLAVHAAVAKHAGKRR